MINAGDGNDSIFAGQGDDEIHGGTGDDYIEGGLGTDIIDGGDGIDRTYVDFRGMAGQSFTFTGNQIVSHRYGTDTLQNMEAIDIYGSDNGDTFTGGSYADNIYGNGGDDMIEGLGGNDVIAGGSGNDTAVATGNFASYTIGSGAGGSLVLSDSRVNGDGTDTLSSIEFIQFADGTYDTATGTFTPSDSDTADPTVVQTSHVSDTLANLEGTAEAGSTVAIRDADGNLIAEVTALADGTWSYEFQTPLMDGDYVYSITATDLAGNVSSTVSVTVSIVVEGQVLNGGNGDDTLPGTDGRDTINGGNGADTLDGGWARDLLFGGNGDDVLYGGAGGDLLQGENGNDRLNGGAGADTIDGGRGDDMLTGGTGNDLFAVDQNSGNDTVTDFTVGEDSLLLSDDITVSSLQQSGGDTLITFSNGAVMTLQDVIVTSVDELFAPPPETTTYWGSDSADLVAA